MEVKVKKVDEDRCQVSYDCTCGCHPGVEYRRGAPTSEVSACCCGALFAVGPAAVVALRDAAIDEPKRAAVAPQPLLFRAPWGEEVPATLAVPREAQGHHH